jgi:AcrR family transcriptional regulator
VSEAQTRTRGRPRLFDEDAVLDELTALFWEKGYSQTSMADLVEASGVHKSSLYSTFGSKDELFATILRRYFDSRMDMFSGLVEMAGPGTEGIHTFLEFLRSDIVSGSSQQGCLLVNTSTELCGTTPGFEHFGVEYRAEMRARLRTLIAQAQSDTAAADALTDQRTDLFLTYMFGLNVIARGDGDEAEIGRAIDSMHAVVDSWGA